MLFIFVWLSCFSVNGDYILGGLVRMYVCVCVCVSYFEILLAIA